MIFATKKKTPDRTAEEDLQNKFLSNNSVCFFTVYTTFI
jgi:hypothetical protein